MLAGPGPLWASAELFIYPTLVILEGAERSASITLTNRGDQIGTFETSWSVLAMSPEGGLIAAEDDVPWSIQPYVRYSPRRVRLEPGGSQVIKIALRRDQVAAEGEYWGHFRVLTLNSEDLPSESASDGSTEALVSPGPEPGISITARSAVAIPIIWRNSQQSSAPEIESAAVDPEGHELTISVRRLGKLSTRGFVHVLGRTQGGEITVLADPVPLVIYPNLERRSLVIRLYDDIPPEMLASNTEVIYASDLDVVNQRTILASHPVERSVQPGSARQ
jgi:P pilus assembly chaperone PapD